MQKATAEAPTLQPAADVACGCNLSRLLEEPSFLRLKGPKGDQGFAGQDGMVCHRFLPSLCSPNFPMDRSSDEISR